MEYKVYVLKEKTGEIVYVGMSTNTKKRFINHKCPTGKFHGRDIELQIVDVYDNKRDALDREATIKFLLGFTNELLTDSQIIGKMHKESGHWERITTNETRSRGGQTTREIRSQSVLVYDKSGKFIGEYTSHTECADKLNLYRGNVTKVVNGDLNSTGGYIIKRK